MLALGTNDVMWGASANRQGSGNYPLAAGNFVCAQGGDEFHGRSHGSKIGIPRFDDCDAALAGSKKSGPGNSGRASDRQRRPSV